MSGSLWHYTAINMKPGAKRVLRAAMVLTPVYIT